MNNEETSIVIGTAAIIRARCDGDALAIRKSVHTVLANLVASDHDLKLVHFQEFVD